MEILEMMTPHSSAVTRPSTLVELLRRRAQQQPEQLAYRFLVDGVAEEVSLTYAGLDCQARAIAASLQALGMAGERAVLLYPPGLEYIAAFFGCLYAGVVAVPVYPPRPRTLWRLQAIVADAQARVALTTTALHATAALLEQAPGWPQLPWLVTDDQAASGADKWQPPAITAASLAFLQYTSGSTGSPKGVMLSHARLLHNQGLIQEAMGQTADSIVLGWLPLYHDMGLIGNVLQPLYVGMPCVLMAPLHFLQQPWRWLQAITRYRATTSGGPNFAYDLCVRKITPEQRARLDLSSWRVAFNGAEPIHAPTLERFAAAFAPCGFRREAFYPCYGLAEATLLVAGGDTTAHPTVRTFAGAALEQHRVERTPPAAKGARTLVGCGRTWHEQRLAIIDPDTRTRCAADQVGEIWVQGGSVALGYWNRPTETAETFHARGAGADDGPFLRSGDLGFVHDGELFVTGRLKDLLILRGRNHYPQDIELTVQQAHASLRAGCGAAFAVEVDEAEQLVVVQEVESRPDADGDDIARAIRRAIAAEHELQAHAIVLIRAGSLPKTSSGKIQRHACRASFLAGELEVVGAWQGNAATTAEPYVAPRTPVEQVVADIWAQVLGVDPVGVHDTFLALGGDSLLGAQIMARVQDALQVQLPPESLLENPTVAELCQRIESTRLTVNTCALAPLLPVARDGNLPLSFAQQRLWFLNQLEPGLPVFNMPMALRLQGGLNAAVLAHSLNDIVRRHEALRATFPTVHGQPLQRIAPALHVPLPLIDLQHIPIPEREPRAFALATAEARRPFALPRGPLLRAVLLRLAGTDHLLLLTMHHMVGDFWSIRIFLQELVALYAALATGRPTPLPEPALHYADFAHWQQQWLQSAALEPHLAYWRQHLAGAPTVITFPGRRPRSAAQTGNGARQALLLSPTLTAALTALSRQHEVTLFITLLAAFKTLLWQYTGGANDIIVGTPISGRTRVEVEGVIGYFLNTLALRTDLTGDPSFQEVLQRLRRVVLEAYAHQEVPFELLVKTLRPERSPQHTPVFQVVFNWQNIPLPILQLPGLTLTPHELDTGTVKHALTLYMRPHAGMLAGTLVYNPDLFDTATMAGMRDDFLAVLHRVVEQPAVRLSQLGTQLTQARLERAVPTARLPMPVRARRQTIQVAPDQLVHMAPLQPGTTLPLLVQPLLDEVDLPGWVRSNRQRLLTALRQHGAILWRGFKVASASMFRQFAAAVTPHLLDYIEGVSPRLTVSDKVYTSTEYPAAYAIAMHNELSYRHTWPATLFFCCLQAPRQGGATPLADSRKVLALLPPDLVARFQRRGVRYVRNFHGGQGSGQSWQTAFATTDRALVETYCRDEGLAWRWKADGGLWLSQARPACIRHPQTGELVWFNQAHQWHLSNLEPEVARALAATVPEDELPMNAYYGDGAALEPEVLETIRAAYRQATVTFPWQAGDILLLDNMLTAHGRQPFVGPRTVLVAMGDPVRLNDCEEAP
jgi:acyl-CoA synthetase (AMP-forming)/AMP-acid ligase II/alpha-ketoglutarate-dependent taurine dioxygenase/acyl carrier protein